MLRYCPRPTRGGAGPRSRRAGRRADRARRGLGDRRLCVGARVEMEPDDAHLTALAAMAHSLWLRRQISAVSRVTGRETVGRYLASKPATNPAIGSEGPGAESEPAKVTTGSPHYERR